ncbi:hypothetical protein CC2G_005969 [Coprinopsis cinerea AmutBmut pab1-1]|nr:hypothetical protein CC2G_005969 [Coprinopsis cinerea AmutBmut pab1-1]
MFRQNLSLMFLGTASGGGPSETRNCSSLLCDFMDDLSLWLVDCAEGTLRQFQFQPQEGFKYRANRVTKIFITHMHADHIMGIVPFLRCVLYPPEAGKKPSYTSNPPSPKVEIYGPAGLRTFVRQIMKMTLTYTADCYTVHELLTKDDPVTPCDLPPLDESAAAAESGFDHNIANPNVMHVSEVRGSDIRADKKGFWKSFVSARGRVQDIEVDAGSIQHRDPCIGFVFRETGPPGRKIVILGDTYDPSQMTPLCLNPPPTLLVHESTDAPIPESADQEGKLSKRDPEEVLQKVLLRGHSVPGMAGAFAKQVKAAHLVLNHIGSRFPAPRNPWDARATVMQEFERQATEAWGVNSKKNASSRGHGRYGHGRGQQSAVAAQDFLRINIPMQGPAMFLFPPSQSKSSGYGDGQVPVMGSIASLSLSNAMFVGPPSASGSHHRTGQPHHQGGSGYGLPGAQRNAYRGHGAHRGGGGHGGGGDRHSIARSPEAGGSSQTSHPRGDREPEHPHESHRHPRDNNGNGGDTSNGRSTDDGHRACSPSSSHSHGHNGSRKRRR